jgi:hypothetical protein
MHKLFVTRAYEFVNGLQHWMDRTDTPLAKAQGVLPSTMRLA